MVLEIFIHIREFMDYLDPKVRKLVGGSDVGELEELW